MQHERQAPTSWPWGSEKPEWSVCTQFGQRAREVFLSWEAIRLELDVKRISLASCKGWNEMVVGARKWVGSKHSASHGHQTVKEGLSSLPEDNVGGSEGTLDVDGCLPSESSSSSKPPDWNVEKIGKYLIPVARSFYQPEPKDGKQLLI